MPLTDEQILEAYALYEKHLWSIVDFAKYLGVTTKSARAIFRGTIHKELKRPDVPYRSRVPSTGVDVRDWYRKKKEEDLAKLAAYL